MYVFGIDLPIMELLFIFLLFFIIALIFIWLEIKNLRKLISQESQDVDRFEKGINSFNLKEDKQDSKRQSASKIKINKSYIEKLESRVKSLLEKGVKMKKIEAELKKNGWPDPIIKKVCDKFT